MGKAIPTLQAPDNLAKTITISRALKTLGFEDGIILEQGPASRLRVEAAQSKYRDQLKALQLEPNIELTVLNQIALRLA